MSNQLIKTTELGKENVFPRTRILDLFDKTSGLKLIDILNSFNMMFVSYLGNKFNTRNQISPELRRQGLWLTYVIDNTVYTEWYDKVAIDDTNWGSDSNWRQGSNTLVGDLSVSPNGTWVINGEDSGITIKGDKGDSPVIRIYNNKILVSYDNGVTYEDLNNTPVYTKFRFNRSTNTYQVSTDLGLNWTDVSSDKVYYQFRYNEETNTHLVSTDFGITWTNISEDKVFYLFRTNDNKLLVSTDLGTTWENCSEPIAAWFRWADVSGTSNVGKILISRDLQNWSDLSPTMTNNLHIKGYVSTVGDLSSNAAIGDIYMVGPTYEESDTTQDYPHYRMWVKQSSGWIDNGEFTNAGPVSTNNIINGAVTIDKLAPDCIDDEPTAGSNNIVKSGGVAASIESLKNKFGIVKEIILTDTVLAYNIDIAPRAELYNLNILIESNRDINVPVYRTINGIQESTGTPIITGEVAVIQIPANTTRLRFVSTGLNPEDTFKFTLTENSELRDELNAEKNRAEGAESTLQQNITTNKSNIISRINRKFGNVYETVLDTTTLAYNIDIEPREVAYEAKLLITGTKRYGDIPMYITVNGTQETYGDISIGTETVLQIPANTTSLRFVKLNYSIGDKFIFKLVEDSELRDSVKDLKALTINKNSIFVSTFDVAKESYDSTEQIKNAVLWLKLYDYTDEFYKDKEIGLAQCSINDNVFIFEIYDYTNNVKVARLIYTFASAAEWMNAGIIIVGNRNTKAQLCFDMSKFEPVRGGVAPSTSTNDYEHRGINIDKCIKDTLATYKSVFVPTASFIKSGFDITHMISNAIKYVKVINNSIDISQIGLSELIWYSDTTILSIKLWDFKNNVELCKFLNYYTAEEINNVRTNLISTNGDFEISIDLTEMNFDVYSVMSDNLNTPFSYECRGLDANLLIQNTISEKWSLTKIDNYTNFQGGIIRKTNSKIENSSGTLWGFVYYPVEKGKTYRIIGNSINVYAAAWAVIAFDNKIPEVGDIVTVIQSYDTEGYRNFDIRYIAPSDGYLLASYFHSDGVQAVPLLYKIIELGKSYLTTFGTNEYSLVYEGLSKANSTFKVGGVVFRGKQNAITPFEPNSFAEQYEPQYAKYLCEAPSKRYGKLIVDDTINMFDASLDAENFNNSYCRQIIGVDSEGWSYIAQRLCNYDFETDEKTKILRTKDFEHYNVFMEGVVGVQLIELENGELCFAANSTDTYDGVTGYYCNIYVTSNHKTVINKKFHTTRTQDGAVGQPWSWGIQSRGSVIAISEYGAHGKVGSAWYSRDFGEHFYHVFEHSMYAPNYPNAHIHGTCVDPYFDRMYIITGDSGKNSRIYWWDYNGEVLSDNLYNTIQWNFIETNMEIYTSCNFQFVCGYALKDCIILGSDGMRGGIMRINRGKKEDTPIIDFGVDFGYAKDGQFSTVWCGGNMFKLDDDSPLLICIHREASNDLEPDDPNNPSNYSNTYRTVLSKVYATYNGYDFSLLWEDDTYGQYDVWTTDDNWETQNIVQKNLAKCGRDMSVYQLPDKTVLLKYIGRSFSYISYNDNGKTNNTKSAYHRFNNYIVKGHLK